MFCLMKVYLLKRFTKDAELILVCDSKEAALAAVTKLQTDDVVSITTVHVNTFDEILKSK